jgi:hypothetical protein
MEHFMFTEATDQQIEFERRRADGDVRRLLDVAGGLGVVTVTGDVVAATPLGARSIGAWLGLGTPESDALSVRVTLLGSADPVIWRRVRVPGDIRLDRFHQVLAAAMGWQDCHLHVFERGADRYGFPDPDLEIRDDRELALGELLPSRDSRSPMTRASSASRVRPSAAADFRPQPTRAGRSLRAARGHRRAVARLLCRRIGALPRSRDVAVVEVKQPHSHTRRGRGKSDPIDAEMAARHVLAGHATVSPQAHRRDRRVSRPGFDGDRVSWSPGS